MTNGGSDVVWPIEGAMRRGGEVTLGRGSGTTAISTPLPPNPSLGWSQEQIFNFLKGFIIYFLLGGLPPPPGMLPPPRGFPTPGDYVSPGSRPPPLLGLKKIPIKEKTCGHVCVAPVFRVCTPPPPSLCLSLVGVGVGQRVRPPHSGLQEPDRIAVINAPDVPRFVYDASRRAQGADPDGASVGRDRRVRDLRYRHRFSTGEGLANKWQD